MLTTADKADRSEIAGGYFGRFESQILYELQGEKVVAAMDLGGCSSIDSAQEIRLSDPDMPIDGVRHAFKHTHANVVKRGQFGVVR